MGADSKHELPFPHAPVCAFHSAPHGFTPGQEKEDEARALGETFKHRTKMSKVVPTLCYKNNCLGHHDVLSEAQTIF